MPTAQRGTTSCIGHMTSNEERFDFAPGFWQPQKIPVSDPIELMARQTE